MTVSVDKNRINYTQGAPGTNTVFAYDFKIFANTDLAVYLDGVLQTITTHYTVSGVLSETGGNVTFVTAPPTGANIVIVRALPLTQLTDYPEGDPFAAVSHENALDRLVMIAQQFGEAIGRVFKVEISSFLNDIEVPVGSGKLIGWNAAADAIALYNQIVDTGVITTRGDLIRGGVSGIAERLGIGATKKVLKSDGTDIVWENEADIILTTRGDILFRNATGLARLGIGTVGQLLRAGGAGADPSWIDPYTYTHKRKIIFPASCFESRVAATWANFAQIQGTNLDFGQFEFDASSDEKIISPPFRFTNWNPGNITARIGWKAAAVAGDVMWIVSFLGRDTTTPEVFDAAFTDHALTAQTVPGTTEYLKESVWTGSVSELANNDAVIMKITRDADNGSDTMAGDAKLLYVEVEYNEA